MNYFLIALFIFSIISPPVHSQSVGQIDTTKEVLSTQEQSQNNSQRDFEDLYKLSKEYNDKILSTVYWALGGIFTFLIGLVGVNIFFRYRFNKKEIENLVQKHSSDIQKIKNDHMNMIKEKFEKFSEETKRELEELNRQNLSDYKENLKVYKQSTDQRIKSLNKSVDDNRDVYTSKLDNLRENFEAKVDKISLDINQHSARIWEAQGMPQIALRNYIDLAVEAFEKDDSTRLFLTLYDIQDTLEKVEYIYAKSKTKLEELLNKIPADTNQGAVTDIKSILKEIDIEKRDN